MRRHPRQLGAVGCKPTSRGRRGTIGAVIGAAIGGLGAFGLATLVGAQQKAAFEKNAPPDFFTNPSTVFLWSPLILGIAAGATVGAYKPQC